MKNVQIVMGSKSDWPTMRQAALILTKFDIEFETTIISAHRTPDRLRDFAIQSEKNNVKIIIAGAGGAAHLPGMIAANTIVPVIGVPIKSKVLNGIDSLLSIVQMPAGVSVATMAIGEAGAKNGAYLATQILASSDPILQEKITKDRQKMADEVIRSDEALQYEN